MNPRILIESQNTILLIKIQYTSNLIYQTFKQLIKEKKQPNLKQRDVHTIIRSIQQSETCYNIFEKSIQTQFPHILGVIDLLLNNYKLIMQKMAGPVKSLTLSKIFNEFCVLITHHPRIYFGSDQHPIDRKSTRLNSSHPK